MPYEITITRAAERMLKKLAPPVRKHIAKEAIQLAEAPLTGSQLAGELRGLRCVHSVYRRTDYRIVYHVNAAHKEVTILAVGSRENFYKQLRGLKLKSISTS